jgi:hypothetical protein
MDRAMEERHLALANKHIRDGQARVDQQLELVERIRARGDSTTNAEAFLDLLQNTLASWQDQRDLIVAELARVR